MAKGVQVAASAGQQPTHNPLKTKAITQKALDEASDVLDDKPVRVL
jgi:hypothetical protein